MEHPRAFRGLISYIAAPALIDKININQNSLSGSRLRMSFLVKKNFVDEFSVYQHNQNTVETVMAMTNMFYKQKSEIKHMHTKVVVVVNIFVCLPEIYCPRQHNICHVEPVSEPTHTVLAQA